MSTRRLSRFGAFNVAVVLAASALVLLGAARKGDSVERVDFGVTRVATSPAYDARLAPATDANIREFIIPVTHDTIEIAAGVKYEGWTFGGTVPGPTIRVREGDLVRVKVVNRSPMPHSIDFHSARIPANEAYSTFMPNDTISFEFTARDPGAYMVHCGTPPVTMHIMQGMYFAIIAMMSVGGDPSSVHFCHKVGMDYVSCSPFRVPIARLAAAQAALKK